MGVDETTLLSEEHYEGYSLGTDGKHYTDYDSDNESDSLTQEPPEDKFKLVLITCCALGISVLFPWNALITANNFWSYVFGEDSTFEFWLSAAFNWPQVPMLLVVTKWGPRFSYTSRIMTSLSIFIVSLLAIPFFCTIGISLNAKWAITLSLAFIAGMAQALNFGTIMGFAAIFPPMYTTAMMSGQGIGGVTIGVLALLFQAIIPNAAEGQAWLYFGCACIIIWATLLIYMYSLRLPYTLYYVKKYYASVEVHSSGTNGHDGEEGTDAKKQDMRWYWNIFKKIWVDALTVFFVFFVTLCLFPGLMLDTELVYTPAVWFNILIPLIFNIFDTCGRSLPYIEILRFPPKFLWIISAVRVVFFPLFIICVNPVIPKYPEFWVYILLIFFGTSNGYTGTLAMMYAPRKVDR
mmetsp:Transcript_9136/g.37658  ORF Transcript_9136/g.37658 Transcript_9136/m.37658 type:complete len:407 (+) Transcript_9136:124-1344(+)